MRLGKQILKGMLVLAFMAVLVLNVKLVNTHQGEDSGFGSLTLVGLVAQAQGEGEGGGGCSASATCYINSPDPPYEPEPYGSVSCSGTTSCTAYYERVVCDGDEQYCGQ